VQVKQLALAGSIKAREVVIPGFLVDVIVINPEQKQLVTDSFNPAYSGDLKIPLGRMDFLPQGQRKIVARRALYEIADDDVVNLGVGIADGIALTASEENWSEKFVLTIEQGIVGGVPARGVIFGASINPTAIIDQAAQFDFYDGGGLDIAFLGFAQVDLKGNVNVSKFGGRIIGTGGFVNISQNASTVVFCGTFTAGGLEATPLDGILNIVQEGAVRKFVREVEQITFSGEVASKNGQRVLYITERAVLRLIDDGLELIEYAPGIDVQKDILDLIDGEIKISHNLKVMDSKIFLDDLLGDSWRAGDKVRRDHK
jgi:propionate CoA-transferase/acetate CoA-transferase